MCKMSENKKKIRIRKEDARERYDLIQGRSHTTVTNIVTGRRALMQISQIL